MNTKCLVCDKETATKIDDTKHYDVVVQMENKRFFYLHHLCFLKLADTLNQMLRKLRSR